MPFPNPLKPFFDIRRGEYTKTFLMSLFFFLVITTFWAMKPMKRSLFIGYYKENLFDFFGYKLGGAQTEQLAKVANMVAALVFSLTFTWMARTFTRKQMLGWCCGFFGIAMLAYALALSKPGAATVWSFYVYGDMFNTVMLTLFWAFMNDIVTSDQAKRLYGIVGLGGVIGGLIGSSFVRSFVAGLGRDKILLLCFIPVVLIAAIGLIVNRSVEESHPPEVGEADQPNCGLTEEGFRLIFSSRHLLSIALMVGMYEVVSSIVDFQLSATAERTIAGRGRDEFFAFLGQVQSGLSIVVQLFLTAFVMRTFGVGNALSILPVVILIGALGYLAVPTLFFVSIMSVGDNSLSYSISQSAKEALYVPTSRCEKYKAKAFIDMFVNRFAKVIAVALNLTASAFLSLENVRWLSLVAICFLVVWLICVRMAGRSFEELTRRNPRMTGPLAVPA